MSAAYFHYVLHRNHEESAHQEKGIGVHLRSCASGNHHLEVMKINENGLVAQENEFIERMAKMPGYEDLLRRRLLVGDLITVVNGKCTEEDMKTQIRTATMIHFAILRTQSVLSVEASSKDATISAIQKFEAPF